MSGVLQFYSMGRPGNMSRPAVVSVCLDLNIYIYAMPVLASTYIRIYLYSCHGCIGGLAGCVCSVVIAQSGCSGPVVPLQLNRWLMRAQLWLQLQSGGYTHQSTITAITHRPPVCQARGRWQPPWSFCTWFTGFIGFSMLHYGKPCHNVTN